MKNTLFLSRILSGLTLIATTTASLTLQANAAEEVVLPASAESDIVASFPMIAGQTYTFTQNTTVSQDEAVGTHGDDWGKRRFQSDTNKHSTINLQNGVLFDDRYSFYGITGTLDLNNTTATDATGGEIIESTMYIDGIRLADNAKVASFLNISQGVHLVVTGTTPMTNNASNGKGAFSLSHYKIKGTVNINGRLTINSAISGWDGEGVINVNNGGEFNLLNGLIRNKDKDRLNNLTVNVESGGTLYATEGVITEHTTLDNNLTVNLRLGSTLGGIADAAGGTATIAKNVNMGANGTDSTIKFDTDIKGKEQINGKDGAYVATTGEGGTLKLTGTTTVQGSLAIQTLGSGTLVMNNISADGKNITLDGAKVELTGTSTVGATTGDEGQKGLKLKNGASLTVSGGKLTTKRLALNESGSNKASSVTLTGGEIHVTDTDTQKELNSNSGGNAKLMIGHWGGSNNTIATHTLTMENGILNAVNAYAHVSWTSKGEMVVKGGEANLYGLHLKGQTDGTSARFEMSGGRVNLGAGGIYAGSNAAKKVQLNGGKLGAMADWSSDATIELGGDVTFDTTKVAVGAGGGNAVAVTGNDAAATIVLKGNTTTAARKTSALNVTGAGTLVLAGGSTTINRATVDSGATLAIGTYADNTLSKGLELSATSDKEATIDGTLSTSDGGSNITINTAVMQNALLSLQADNSLELQNVVHHAGTQIVGSAAASSASLYSAMRSAEQTGNAVTLANSTLYIAASARTANEATNTADNEVLTAIGLSEGAKGYSFTSNAYKNVSLTLRENNELYLADDMAETLKGYDYLALSFDNVKITSEEENSALTVYLADINPACIIADNTIFINTAAVPEPTTATLSILALAALAARRRRK